MELFYVFTPNGIVFYTGISLSDRFKQYQMLNPLASQQELPRLFSWETRTQPNIESERCFWNSSDRFKQYQTSNSPAFQQEFPRFSSWGTQTRPNTESDRPSWNSFEKAPVVWDSTFYGQTSFWTCVRETNSSKGGEPIIYSPSAVKKKKRKNRKRKRAGKIKKDLTKEELDDEIDRYMIKCF